MSQGLGSMRVLTFNLWGIFNSKMRTERMIHFVSKIEHYDVILLQEQFDSNDLTLIKEHLPPEVRERYFFSRFQTGFYGCGCAVISKYPIISAFSYVYPLQGFPEMLLHGDFFANKGAARVVVNVPVPASSNDILEVQHQPVIIYITHLVAVYQKVRNLPSRMDERYLPFRISQAISLANYIINTSSPRNYIIIGGDFNSSQNSLEVRMMLILLKNKGYRMQSVLPPPSDPAEALANATSGGSEAAPLVLEPLHSFYTYSYRNAFNASRTSYFKLLKQEADIPSQIDHLFFSSNTFEMEGFEDCPDAAEGYPFYREEKDGGRRPNGVVVFTANEVRRSGGGSRLGGWALAAWGALRRIATTLSGATPKTPTAADPVEVFPISDHYGVASRLRLRARSDGRDVRNGVAVMSPTLRVANFSQEELETVRDVVDFLKGHVSKFRRQTKMFRIISAVSVAVVVINAYFLMQAASAQEKRTAELLRRLYFMKLGDNYTNVAEVPHYNAWNEEISNFFQDAQSIFPYIHYQVVSWVFKILQIVGLGGVFGISGGVTYPFGATIDDRCLNDRSNPDFGFIAKSLANRPFWSNVMPSSVIHVVASLFGLSAFLIGNIQRLGNAKVLDDEVNMIITILSQSINGFANEL